MCERLQRWKALDETTERKLLCHAVLVNLNQCHHYKCHAICQYMLRRFRDNGVTLPNGDIELDFDQAPLNVLRIMAQDLLTERQAALRRRSYLQILHDEHVHATRRLAAIERQLEAMQRASLQTNRQAMAWDVETETESDSD